MIFETHAHLNSKKFIGEVDNLVKEAREFGVAKILDVACGIDELTRSLEISKKYEDVYTAVGVHPVDYKIFSEKLIDEYEELIKKNNKIIAFGEIGLDYHWYPETKDMQISMFKYQMKVAQKNNLPVIIHCRDAAEDCIEVLKEFAPITGVVHSFSEDYNIAKRFIDLGLHIGITGPVTFKNGDKQREVVKKIDITKLLVETDSPYMAPVPMRGKVNKPQYLKYIIEKIAEVRDEELSYVENQIYINSTKLFKDRNEDV